MSFKTICVFLFFVVFFVIIHISLLNNDSNVIGNICKTETNVSGICIPLSECVINNENKMFKLNNYNKCSASAFPNIICCPDNYLQYFHSKTDGTLKEKQPSLSQKNDFDISRQQRIQREIFNHNVIKRRKYQNSRTREIRSIDQPSNTLTQDQWNSYLDDIRSGKIEKQGQTIYVDCKSINLIPDMDTLDLVMNIEIECGDEKYIITTTTTTAPPPTTTTTTIAPESTTIESIKISSHARPEYSSESEEDVVDNTAPLPQTTSTEPVIAMRDSKTDENSESDEDIEGINKYNEKHLSVTEFHKFVQELTIQKRTIQEISVSFDCDEIFFFESDIELLDMNNVNYTCQEFNSEPTTTEVQPNTTEEPNTIEVPNQQLTSLTENQETTTTEIIIESTHSSTHKAGTVNSEPTTTEEYDATPTRKAVTACNEWKEKSRLYPHIIGGVTVEPGEFPYMAALGYLNAGDDEYSFECGSTLISTDFVITAAHCVKRKTPKIIRMGKLTPSSFADKTFPVDRNIKNTFIHPNYTTKVKYHDIALLELDKPVDFTSLVYPACLHANETDLEDDTAMTVAGWGIRSIWLKKTNVNVVLRSECNSKYILNGLARSGVPEGLDGGQMCAMDKINFNDSCQGDSGGPLLIVDELEPVSALHGIVSFGAYCASVVPSVYVKVNYYLDWIESIVWPDE